MEGLWLISYIALWVFVLLEGFILLALARQIGLLHVQFGPVGGARVGNHGPSVGDAAPTFTEISVTGKEVTLGVNQKKRTFLAFIAPECSSCKEILPGLKTLHRAEKDTLQIIIASVVEDMEDAHQFIRENSIDGIPLVPSRNLAVQYQVASVPYVVLIDQEGIVRSKGIVNHTAHLESLLNAEELGYDSIQSFIEEQDKNLIQPKIAA